MALRGFHSDEFDYVWIDVGLDWSIDEPIYFQVVHRPIGLQRTFDPRDTWSAWRALDDVRSVLPVQPVVTARARSTP